MNYGILSEKGSFVYISSMPFPFLYAKYYIRTPLGNRQIPYWSKNHKIIKNKFAELKKINEIN